MPLKVGSKAPDFNLKSKAADGLKDVESCSHLVLLYWMDRSRRDLVLQVPLGGGDQVGASVPDEGHHPPLSPRSFFL